MRKRRRAPARAPPPPPKRTPPATRRPRILLGATGSVATVKVPKLAVQLTAFADVRVVATERGRFFLGKARTYDGAAYGAFEQAQIEILSDDDEWARWNKVGDPVLHVDLREWADLLLIAPLGANTLAKLANGLCDDLLSCTARAWDLDKPVVVAPAMNTAMWSHPMTAHHLAALRGVYDAAVVAPVSKALACGDVGVGALADVDDVAAAARAALGLEVRCVTLRPSSARRSSRPGRRRSWPPFLTTRSAPGGRLAAERNSWTHDNGTTWSCAPWTTRIRSRPRFDAFASARASRVASSNSLAVTRGQCPRKFRVESAGSA